MDFSLSDDQLAVRAAIEKICAAFGDDYWLARDRDGRFPHEFHRAIAHAGWLGICMPEEYGGAALGVTEAAIMMRAIAQSGGGFSAASSIHMNIFGLNPVVVFGSVEQKQRMLPPLIRGEQQACFAVTEPDAGLNTTGIKTKAIRAGDHYVVSGAKVWTSTAQVAHKMLILVRTTPRDQVPKSTDGMTLFYTDLDRSHVEVREIEKMGRKCVDSNQLFIDGLRVPVDDRIGEEGRGFEYILHGMNPERILIGAESVGLGLAALSRATRYARERVVFDRPIGENQAIQHPLAQNWMELQAADLMVMNAAALYDGGKPCGAEANAAKHLGGEAGFRACEQAVLTHGGYGYAREYHVERYFRDAKIHQIWDGTNEIQRIIIARELLGREAQS